MVVNLENWFGIQLVNGRIKSQGSLSIWFSYQTFSRGKWHITFYKYIAYQNRWKNISKVLTEYYIDCMIVSVFWLYAVNAINMLFLCTITQFRSSYYIHTTHYKKKDINLYIEYTCKAYLPNWRFEDCLKMFKKLCWCAHTLTLANWKYQKFW